MSETNDFLIKNENLQTTAAKAIETATGLGATGAVAEVSESVGQSVSVRKGETETIEFSRDKYLGITVYCGKKQGVRARQTYHLRQYLKQLKQLTH